MDASIYFSTSHFAVRPAMYIDLTSSYVTDAGTVHAYPGYNASPDLEPDPNKDKSEYKNPRYADTGTVDAYNTVWDCVYFGRFKQSAVFTESPIEWRVLSVEGNEAVLLAEDGLICIEYDLTNNYFGDLRLKWPNATLRSWLNEDDPDSYPDEPPFINTAFNEAEKKAIIETKHVFPSGISDTIESVDKVYLLSVDELKDPVYGFVDEDGECNSDSLKAEPSDYAFFRQCNGVFKENTPDPIKWWLSDTYRINNYWYASCVNEDGMVIDFDTFKENLNLYSVKASERGDSSVAARPAIHVDLSSPCVQFAGRVNSRGETQTAEEILNLPVTAATITTQPKGQKLNWGYKETTPLTVAADDIAGHSLSYMWYQSDSKDTGKGTPINGAVEKSYTIPAGADTGTKYYYCAVTSTRLENGQTKTTYSDFAEVTVEKVPSSVTKAPEAVIELKYTGQPIALVLAGTANGGAIQYALGADDKTPPAADAYSASVPTATDAGTYHVWYMSSGDKNHTDSVAECVTVVVAKGESRDPKNPSDQPTDPADPQNPSGQPTDPSDTVTQPKPVVVPVKTKVQVGDETISLNIQTSLKNEVTYTGKTIDPEKDLDMKVDTRSLTDAVKIPAGVKAEQLIAVTYVQTNARNASVVKDKKATVFPKLKVTKKAKKKLSSSDYKKLKKLVAAANSALKNNTCEYTINPLPLKDCQVEVHAKLKKKKIQIKNGKLKGLKSVKVKIPGAKKKTTLGSGMYEIGSPDKENGTVSVTGLKNYTGTVTVTVKK
ncbi:MAG: DUF6273 domain-containing protein [Lachnospiraceae bacterium]|nr:DUF6273 domain-containing protein [Lachnospiraceae bacterium]